MQKCWAEVPEERPSFGIFIETLESLYELKTSINSKENYDNTSCAYRMKLRYASLAFHEESLEKQFQTIKEGNFRYVFIYYLLEGQPVISP